MLNFTRIFQRGLQRVPLAARPVSIPCTRFNDVLVFSRKPANGRGRNYATSINGGRIESILSKKAMPRMSKSF
jgi:hypothetical protein